MSEVDYDKLILAHPAAVILRSQDELRAQAIAARALDETSIEGEDPYFFSAEVSNNRLDSHYTRMAESSLRNYADDANSGVSFLYSHDPCELIGRSIGGKFVGAQGNGVARVTADFFALPNLQLGAVQSDQVIRAMKTSVLRDVSIGFYGGELICSICGRDILRDWDCWHYPGFTYEVEGDKQVKEETCTADVENARLAECSGVYKGSTPGASITRGVVVVKAEREAEAGRIKPETRHLIETRYRIHLPEKRVAVPGHKEQAMPEPKPEEKPTEQETRAAQPEIKVEDVRAILSDAGLKEGELLPNLRTLAEQAKDGRAYREVLIDEAIKEGVRANGAEFKVDEYKRTLQGLPIETVRTMKDDWARIASANIKGGRQTTDEGQPPEPAQQTPPAYTAAYSAS